MPVLKSSVTHFLHNIILLWDSSKGEKESERKIPVAIVIILTNSDLKLGQSISKSAPWRADPNMILKTKLKEK